MAKVRGDAAASSFISVVFLFLLFLYRSSEWRRKKTLGFLLFRRRCRRRRSKSVGRQSRLSSFYLKALVFCVFRQPSLTSSSFFFFFFFFFYSHFVRLPLFFLHPLFSTLTSKWKDDGPGSMATRHTPKRERSSGEQKEEKVTDFSGLFFSISERANASPASNIPTPYTKSGPTDMF